MRRMSGLPSTFKKLSVKKITNNFRDAVELVSVEIGRPRPKHVLIRNRFVGVNASDINWTAGKYDPRVKVPFDCGFEGVGDIVDVGEGCSGNVRCGQSVGYMYGGAFAEFINVPEKAVIPLPNAKAELLPLIVSGLTAAICLDKVGEIKKGETVLVTAAAGGTGHFAVQLAKDAGCHVIGTCSSDEKVQFLKKLGCDRAINYKKEKLGAVLHNEYKNGIDVVYESVGGDMFDAIMPNLAVHGRMVVVGFLSGYETQRGFQTSKAEVTLMPRLLQKSCSVRGFFLNHYVRLWPEYLTRLSDMLMGGRIRSVVDTGPTSREEGPFTNGLADIPRAIQYLYAGKNVGKIVVEMADTATTSKL